MSSNILIDKNYQNHDIFTVLKEFNLSKALSYVNISGKYLEFGVWRGRTINFIAKKINDNKIYDLMYLNNHVITRPTKDKVEIIKHEILNLPSILENKFLILLVMCSFFSGTLKKFFSSSLQNR